MRSARPESPTPDCCCVSSWVPTLPPKKKARITNATQPTTAVLRWRALQRPTDAARLRFGLDMNVSIGGGGCGLRWLDAGPSGRRRGHDQMPVTTDFDDAWSEHVPTLLPVGRAVMRGRP